MLGEDDTPLLLVFDTYEEMRDLDNELWSRFLPSVCGPVLVLLSGRVVAPVGGRSSGWHRLIDEIVLPGLADAESRGLLASLGVRDGRIIAQIVAMAAGSPLLLSLAAEVYRSGGAQGFRDLAAVAEVSRSLIARMTRELHDPAVRRLLEAASLVRTFDEELLGAMVPDVSAETFDRLCELSVVRVTPAGARAHDLVRQSVSAELRWRAPGRYAALRRRAAEHLLSGNVRSARHSHRVTELLYLVGEAAGTGFFLDAEEHGLRLRGADRDELPALEHLCRGGVHNFGASPAQRMRELRADFPVAREWFVVAVADERPVAYGYSLPLSEATWQSAASARGAYFDALPGPELAAIKVASVDDPAAFLIVGTVYLEGHAAADGAVRLATFTNRHVLAPSVTHSHLLLPHGSPFEPTAESLGIRRRLTGISLQAGEPPVDEWVLDYGDRGFSTWVEHWLELPEPASGLDQVPEGALIDQVKLALEDLYRPTSLAKSPLVGLTRLASDEGSATALRALLLGRLRDLEQAESARDREAASLLSAYYVKRVGSHEVIAERLGLPRTTFYRRLRHGLRLLASRLRVEEALARGGAGEVRAEKRY